MIAVKARMICAIVSVVVLAGSMVACSPASDVTTVSMSGKTYDAAETVASEADMVMIGTLERVIARASDDGGTTGGPSFPMALWEFSMEASNPTERTATVKVSWFDTDKLASKDVPVLRAGGTYVLMVNRFVPPSDSSLSDWGTTWIPNSSGIFWVRSGSTAPGSTASAMQGDLQSVKSGGRIRKDSNGRMSCTVGELLELPVAKK